jgi:pimeloyl-ACP methyl ester carboxylesterase
VDESNDSVSRASIPPCNAGFVRCERPGETASDPASCTAGNGRGPVHLWCRGNAEPTKVVVYVHGYRDDVDSAFADHQLAAQFAKSNIDALFIAVEAPSGPDQPVAFADLDALLELVGAPLHGPVLVIGHSGGFRTLKAWLKSERVQEVVVLDGFYGDTGSWERWLTARPNARLRLVGQATWDKAEAWRVSLPVGMREQVTHQRANCRHMEIVTRGSWLPRVIQESKQVAAEPGRI